MLILLLLVLLLFGPKKIPEIARMLGRGLNEVKKVQREINTEIHRYSEDIEKEAREMDSAIKQYTGTQDNAHHQKKEKSDIADNEKKHSTKEIQDSAQATDYGRTDNVKPGIAGNEEAEQPGDDASGSHSTEDDGLPYPYNKKDDTE